MPAGKLHAIRLCDIPFEERMRAARLAARQCHTEEEVDEVLFAAMFPSQHVHWVREAALVAVDDERRAA